MKEQKYLMRIGLFVSLLGLGSCHQEPQLPASLIPLGCRLATALFVSEAYSDSSAYLYDPFGHVTQASFVRREKGRLVRQAVSTFTYLDDHYLNNRTDRLTVVAPNGQVSTGTGTFVYEYGGTPKRILSIRRATLSGALDTPISIAYQYAGNQLSQYTEVDAGGATSVQAFFGADGQLNRLQKSDFQVIDVVNGLVSRTVSKKDTVRYSYEGRQPVGQEISLGTSGERIQRTVTYDGRLPQRTGELKLPGFPANNLDGLGQPLGNLLTETFRRYRNGALVETTLLRYTYTYNAQNYPVGYTRSDGARAQFYYINCP